MRVFRGIVVHCKSSTELEVIEDGAVVVDAKGIIVDVGRASECRHEKSAEIVELGRQFIVPGLIDTHAHAPQYAQLGTGTDLTLLKWLEKYTFPTEARFADVDHARLVYRDAVRRVLRNGTTTCVWFASLHLEASKVLVDVCLEEGLHAFVGKVCMDRNSPDTYREPSWQASLAATREFVEYTEARGGQLVRPIVTPRFAISCSHELMEGLGALAAEKDLPVQSHIAETCDEIAFTRTLHPENANYADVYRTRGLLTKSTIMAHGVHLSDAELVQFAATGAGVSHCPRSNLALCSGLAPVRQLLRRGLHVGLGTDMSGGPNASLWDAMRGAVETSAAVSFGFPTGEMPPLSFREALHLATLGGAALVGMEDRLGSFAPGKWFSAQVVDPRAESFDTYAAQQETAEELFQKCFYLLDDRNISHVYVKGRRVK
jgi:guanine deaminase